MVNTNGASSGKRGPGRRPLSERPLGQPADAPGAGAFGALLRHLRDAADLSQEDLFERGGPSVEAISALERGLRRHPHRETVRLLADALGLSGRARLDFEAAAGFPRPEERSPIGRKDEWAWLRHGIEGDCALLALVGTPGIGKSHLLGALADWASANEWRVLRGDCRDNSGQEPFSPITEAIKLSVRALPREGKRAGLSGCAWLARLLPELAEDGTLEPPRRSFPPEQERRLMFEAVDQYVQNVRGGAGTLLVLDDLQWAGADTMDLLDHVIRSAARAAGTPPVRIVAAYRPADATRGQPITGLVSGLAKGDHVARLVLTPLGTADAARLASDILGPLLPRADEGAGRALVERLVERTGGVPFYLVNLAKGLRSLALERVPGASGEGDAGLISADLDRIPWTVAEYVRQQVAALSPTAQALLAVAAVAAVAVAGDVLVECVGRSEREALPDLEAACKAGLLTEDPENGGRVTYRYVHDLLREAVDGDLSAGRRRVLHQGLGEALERRIGKQGGRSGDSIPRIAQHFARAGDQEKAATYLRQAGDRARAANAHGEAARGYEQLAADLDELGRPREAADARRDQGAELAHAGRFAEALKAFQAAERTYRKVGDAESLGLVAAAIATAHAARGTGEAGLAHLRSVIAALEGNAAVSPATRARLLDTLSHTTFMEGHYHEAVRAAEDAIEVARPIGDGAQIARAQLALGVALLSVGRLREASDQLECAIAGADAAGEGGDGLSLRVETRLMAIWIYQTRGGFARSRALVDEALEAAQRLGNVAVLGQALFFDALLAYYTGDWGRARAICDLSAGVLGTLDSTQIGSYPPLGLGWLCMVEGRREEALRHLEVAAEIARRSDGDQVLRLIEALRAEDELVRGEGAAAHDRLVPVLTAGPLQERTRIELGTLRAWGALQMGMVDEAEEMAVALAERAGELDMRLFQPDALRVRALCATRRGSWREAEEALEEALALCREMPYPYAEAKALCAHGRLYVAMGDVERARERFERARAICGRLGERMYGAAIEREIAAIAGSAAPGRPSGRRRPVIALGRRRGPRAEAHRRAQLRQLGLRQRAGGAGGEAVGGTAAERERADAHAPQRQHGVPDRLEHAAHLAVAPFVDLDAHPSALWGGP